MSSPKNNNNSPSISPSQKDKESVTEEEKNKQTLNDFLRFAQYISTKEIKNSKEIEIKVQNNQIGKANKNVRLVDKMSDLDKTQIPRNQYYFLNGKKIEARKSKKKQEKKNIVLSNISIKPSEKFFEESNQMKQMPFDMDMLLKEKLNRKRENERNESSTTTGGNTTKG